jgi:WS/DGAT/MGAT family acyltransferase
MSAEDAAFLYFEKPDAPLHIGSLGIFEGAIDFGQLYASIDARMHLIPRYRQMPVIPPFYAGHPTWEDDTKFSLERHMRHVRMPAPGTDLQLRELCSELFEPMLARDRPLWDIIMIYGLEGDRTAMLSRVHHCLVDGVSGVELLLALLDLVPNPEPTPQPAEPWQPKARPTPWESWADATFEAWTRGLRNVTEFQQNLLDPRGQMRRMTDLAHAFEVALPAALRQPPKAIWNKPVSGKRRVAWSEMSFQEVRRIRSAIGGTVNDVMLTLLGGALGRYLQTRGQKVDGTAVRMMIPVNVRSEDQKGALGNRVSMMLPDIPLGIADPVARLQAVRQEMQRLKDESQANAFEALAGLSENIPAALHAMAGINGVPPGGANMVCTNVPGPMIPLWSVGHRLLASYPMLPLAGDLGIGAGIMSFNKSLYFGIMSDPTIIGDVDLIAQYLDDEFRALREAAGVPESDLPDIGAPVRSTNGNGHSTNGHAPAHEPPPAPLASQPEPEPRAAQPEPEPQPMETEPAEEPIPAP